MASAILDKLRHNDIITNITSLVGTLTLAYSAYATTKFLWHFLRPSQLHVYRHPGPHQTWALVTGASDGIGLAFAHELLARDFNVLLHGRNETKLANIRTELLKLYPTKSVEYVVADASAYDDAYMTVAEKVKSLPGKLTILVNNVGGIMTKPQYAPHGETAHDHIDAVLNLNARFMTHLTAELLPILRASGRSAVLNVGSVTALMGIPFIGTYSATKGYIHAFTASLKTEMVAMGGGEVDVVGFVVGNVASGTNTRTMPFLAVTTRQCAAGCLDKAGGRGEAMVWAHWRFVLPTWATLMMPAGLMRKVLGGEMRKRMEEERKGS